ncbi:MAG: ABC transporter permease, partial [Planctomycetota bacterium]|nr:ABC transporter permease [Planctomycetota bacterium]
GVALGSVLLARWAQAAAAHPTASGLSLRNAARRRGRSMATLALLASGVFLVVAVGANRRDPAEGAEKRSSGTGGFALFAQASLPLIQDLNSDAGRETYNLSKDEMANVAVVPLRVRAGDDASCLNLNRAQTPQLWGVDPEELARREAFSFASAGDGPPGNPWLRLSGTEPDGAIPAIGDMNSVMWALGQSVGGTLEFTDGRGAPFKVRIVATLATSVLQGGLAISEKHFIERYPGESGYRLFLIDAPRERLAAVSKLLSERLIDQGFEVQPAARRLAEFGEVENTYLSTFQVLGGLGLLLGSIGMGVLVMRNVLERRGELALLRAVGFRIALIRRLVAGEHAALFAGGLLCGLAAALVAVVPALRSPGAGVPYASLGLTVLAVAFSGLLWTWLAVAFALRGELLDGLRGEGS